MDNLANHHRRGPFGRGTLSPLLFILAIDPIHRLLDQATREGILSRSLTGRRGTAPGQPVRRRRRHFSEPDAPRDRRAVGDSCAFWRGHRAPREHVQIIGGAHLL